MELLVFICLATVAFYGLFLWLLVSLLWRGEAGPRTRSFVANGLFLLAAFATLGAVVETVSGFRWGRSLGELAVYAALLPLSRSMPSGSPSNLAFGPDLSPAPPAGSSAGTCMGAWVRAPRCSPPRWPEQLPCWPP
ncbi:hypothetical protein ACFSZS_26755 [Seohaeicola zhoushanensis]